MKKKDFNLLFKEIFSLHTELNRKKEIIDIFIEDDPNNINLNSNYAKFENGNIVYNSIIHNDIDLFKYIESKNLIDYNIMTNNEYSLLDAISASSLEELKNSYYIDKILSNKNFINIKNYTGLLDTTEFFLETINSKFFKPHFLFDNTISSSLNNDNDNDNDFFVDHFILYLLSPYSNIKNLHKIVSRLNIEKDTIQRYFDLNDLSNNNNNNLIEYLKIYKDYNININDLFHKYSIDQQINFVRSLNDSNLSLLKDFGIEFFLELKDYDSMTKIIINSYYNNDIEFLNNSKYWAVDKHIIFNDYNSIDLFSLILAYREEVTKEKGEESIMNIRYNINSIKEFYSSQRINKIKDFKMNLSYENISYGMYNFKLISEKDFYGIDFLLKKMTDYISSSEKNDKNYITKEFQSIIEEYITKNKFNIDINKMDLIKVKNIMLDLEGNYKDAFDFDNSKNKLLNSDYLFYLPFKLLTSTDKEDQEFIKKYFYKDIESKIILNIEKIIEKSINNENFINDFILLSNSLNNILGKDKEEYLEKSINLFINNTLIIENKTKAEKLLLTYNLNKNNLDKLVLKSNNKRL